MAYIFRHLALPVSMSNTHKMQDKGGALMHRDVYGLLRNRMGQVNQS